MRVTWLTVIAAATAATAALAEGCTSSSACNCGFYHLLLAVQDAQTGATIPDPTFMFSTRVPPSCEAHGQSPCAYWDLDFSGGDQSGTVGAPGYAPTKLTVSIPSDCSGYAELRQVVKLSSAQRQLNPVF